MASRPQKKSSSVPSSPLLKKFIAGFKDSIPDEDRPLVDDTALAQTAQRHLEMTKARRPGTPAIRIHTPAGRAADGSPAHTIIDIVNDDMPFLVASVAAEITLKYKLIRILLHPMLHVKRSGGALADLVPQPGSGAATQSHMHIELEGTLAAPVARELEDGLNAVLRDVRYATRDWQAMREELKKAQKGLETAAADGENEYADFLDYLYNDNFTLLGCRSYRYGNAGQKSVIKASGLGLLHTGIDPAYIDDAAEGLNRPATAPVAIAKLSRRSTVHRPVPLDAVTVVQYGRNGKPEGETLFIGLFTSVTYSRSIQDVPLLRRKTETVLARSGFRAGGHNYKALRHVLEKYPRDELFQMDEEALLETCVSIMHLQERQRIALYLRADTLGRHVSCLVYVPRDRYDTQLRQTLQSILEEELDGKTADFYITLDDSPLARAMFVILTAGAAKNRNVKAIEARLQKAGRLWQERLADHLLHELPSEKEALETGRKYAAAFPANYQEVMPPKQTLFDIRKIEECLAGGKVALDFYKCKHCGSDQVRLKVFHPDRPMTLSDVLPVLENMGLRVISENPYEVKPAGAGKSVWIHDFMMLQQGRTMDEAALAAIKAGFEAAFAKIWYGEAENDSLNQLCLTASLSWRAVSILRAYVRYMRQMGYSFGTRYIEQALTRNPQIAGDIARLFKATFDPAAPKDAAKKTAGIAAALAAALENVASLDEDRILRSMINLVEATLRTNYFQTGPDGQPRPCLAFKFDSGKIRDLPRPVPYREIFVYSPRVEGVHLRGDVIARGGIRWSDRHEDFRTEILGLLKAQQVKNSVIVPMGAKGGFVLKKAPPANERAAYAAEGVECYKLFIGSLLDITDNRRGGKVTRPKDVVCLDGEDPYLVVAADKGTASFSDTANALSLQYGHWLGDAFASGGSAGYDHKKMGITARGAWESVKRHFRELGHDIQKQPFSVIGVGDMGGDVFGNGMLLSPEIRLIGAFNHMHIFCDPEPDAAKSLAERQRLFAAVKGWGDYDTKKLSPGGRIFLRSEKSLTLTPQIRARFDITAERVTPAELIQAMLRARADLLWFGGIGTYVKATHQDHEDVGDRGNESLRIDAKDVRALVIGEGANLAVTQAARIEMAQRGVKLNADFIDNSGGVDSSDHEVNIKILMTEIMAGTKHKMSLAARNKLLAQMTGEVGALVLRNNYQQAQAISLMEVGTARTLPAHARFIRDLEKRQGLDRALEGLPDDEEIEERLAEHKGLTRPELAILMSYAKIQFARELLASEIPDLPAMQDYWLINYFPVPLRKKFRAEILGHRLRREIIATTMANSMINRMGSVFVRDLMDKSGASCGDVARAYLVVRDSYGMRAFWDRIEALDSKIPGMVQLRAMDEMARMIQGKTLWMLTRLGRRPDLAADTESFGKGIAALRTALPDIVQGALADALRRRTEGWQADGLPRDIARELAAIPAMEAAFDIVNLAATAKTGVTDTARCYFELGEVFGIDWLRSQAQHLQPEDRWENEALESLADDLNALQATLTLSVLKQKPGRDAVGRWLKTRDTRTAPVIALLADMRRSTNPDLPMLVVAARRLRALTEG